MTKPYDCTHQPKTDPHAANRSLYALDALHSATPWTYWQCYSIVQGWIGGFTQEPSWIDGVSYRRYPYAPVWSIKYEKSTDMINRLSVYSKGDMKLGKTERETLELNNWVVGDILEGDEGEGADRILITAIGEERFLCKWDYKCKGVYAKESGCTTLNARKWSKVGTV